MATRTFRTATVLATTEDECTVATPSGSQVVAFAPQFPTPRVERVLPGHLVAISGRVVVWRWFDALVTADEGGSVELWEPSHGSVRALRRRPERRYRPGTRAYLSAGLPGADWWVAGAVDVSKEPDLDLDELDAFLTEIGL